MPETAAIHATDIPPRIRRFIRDNFLFGTDTQELAEDASLVKQGVIDSTGILELVAFLEETFQIKVEDEELIPGNLDTLRNLTTYIAGKRRNVA